MKQIRLYYTILDTFTDILACGWPAEVDSKKRKPFSGVRVLFHQCPRSKWRTTAHFASKSAIPCHSSPVSCYHTVNIYF